MSSSSILATAASPIKIGPKLVLQHRLVMAPMTRRQCGPNGIPTDKSVIHYTNRTTSSSASTTPDENGNLTSGNDIGFSLLISEGVFVNAKKDLVGDAPNIPHIGNDEAVQGWKKVTDAIRAKSGGKTLICGQLWHTGRYAFSTAVGAKSVGPLDDEYDVPVPSSASSTSTTNLSAEELKKLNPKAQIHGLTKDEIQELIGDYAAAASRAVHKAGFDAIEAHFAHGYLFDSFINPDLNKRDDEFGGESLENRLRFPSLVIKAMREAINDENVPIILRTSQWSVGNYDARNYRTPKELEFALKIFVTAGINAIHISTRRVTDAGFPEHHPTRTLAGWASYFLKEKKSLGEEGAKVLVIGVGGVCVSRTFARDEFGFGVPLEEFKLVDPAPALALIEKGEMDLLAIGRAAIADADICGKILSGNWDKILPYNPECMKVYP